ncbi:hypothetical protein FHS33_006694 [Streptomyces calvus]|uniref:Uncharacterized protein n=1 Tax=Streptomyces calvus TaxID=67282 RepID=A0AA40SKK8_9ACTN|nr:hypothetical protein [Streptomyces calvus]
MGAAVSPAIRTPAHPATDPSRIRHAHRAAGPPGLPTNDGPAPLRARGPASPRPAVPAPTRPAVPAPTRPAGPCLRQAHASAAPSLTASAAHPLTASAAPALTASVRPGNTAVQSAPTSRTAPLTTACPVRDLTTACPVPDLTTACPVPDLTTACPVPDLTTACPVRASPPRARSGPRRAGPGAARPRPPVARRRRARAVTVPTVVEWCRCRGSRTAARHRARRDRASAPEFAGVRDRPPRPGTRTAPGCCRGPCCPLGGWYRRRSRATVHRRTALPRRVSRPRDRLRAVVPGGVSCAARGRGCAGPGVPAG